MRSRCLRMTQRAAYCGLGAALAAVLFFGCGSDEMPRLVPVAGKVLLNKEPLGGAVVNFVANGGNAAQTSSNDATDADGSFVATYRGHRGLSPGKYKVTVTKMVVAGDADQRLPEKIRNDPVQVSRIKSLSKKNALPRKYSQPQTTIEVEIPEPGKTDVVLELTGEIEAESPPATAPAGRGARAAPRR
jgi:hypothetical protein